MLLRHKLIGLTVLATIAVVAIVHFSIPKGPVTIAFLRYEKSGDDWHARMEIRNHTSKSILYHSAGPTSTQYIWDSPQIDYERRIGSPLVTLEAKRSAPFRVLLMTTDHDWRVGIDYEINAPGWSALLPAWLVKQAQRLGIMRSGKQQRAWSSQITKPTLVDEVY